MKLVQKYIVYDKYGLKYKLYLFLDKIFKTNLHPYSTSIKYKYDILNIKRKKWRHPVTYEINNTSFIDLMNMAEKDFISTKKYIDKYFSNKISLTKLKNIIKNIDYATGIIQEENKRMKYFEY